MIIVLIVVILGVFLGYNVTFSGGKIELKRAKLSRVISETEEACKVYLKLVEKYKNSILKQQMTLAESTIHEICRKIDAPRQTYDLIMLKIRCKFKENGIGCLDSGQFSKYVGQAIDEIRDIIRNETDIEDIEFIISPEFTNRIANIFNEGLDAYNHWNSRSEQAEEALQLRLEEIRNGC